MYHPMIVLSSDGKRRMLQVSDSSRKITHVCHLVSNSVAANGVHQIAAVVELK